MAAAHSLWVQYRPGDPCQIVADGKVLFRSPATQYYPVWLDVDHVAFTSNIDGDWEIYRYAPKTRHLQRITQSAGWDYSASPDHHGGMVFISMKSGNHEVWHWTPAGNMTRLTHWNAYTTHPVVLSNGDLIVSSNYKNPGSKKWATADGRFDLYLLDPHGKLKRQLTDGAGDKTSPVCLSDGRIVYANNVSGRLEIWIYDGKRHRMAFTDPDGELYAPALQTDGTLLATLHRFKGDDRRLSTRDFRYLVRLDLKSGRIVPLTESKTGDASSRGY